jgi:photosystem II stability/assembly factor-like uncharacterized protein
MYICIAKIIKAMSISKIILYFLLFFSVKSFAQRPIELIAEQKGVSLRGLSVPSEAVIWASGSKGTIAKSLDGGKQFEWMQVKGFETRDFRAIHAFNDQEAIIVAVASPGIILKTIDGGMHWDKVYENKDTAIFLDAISFKDDHGMVIGDPIDQKIVLLTSKNRGQSWESVGNDFFKSTVKEGESFFASSGTNLIIDFKDIFFVSGGIFSRCWINGEALPLPIIQGKQSTGANSLAISPNNNHITIVGGDFMNEQSKDQNIVRLDRFIHPNSENKTNRKRSYFWKINPKVNTPNGYKSCVQYISNKDLIVCGTSGVDFSNDGGISWMPISTQPFHVLKVVPGKRKVILAGSGGRIALVNMD